MIFLIIILLGARSLINLTPSNRILSNSYILIESELQTKNTFFKKGYLGKIRAALRFEVQSGPAAQMPT